MNPHPRKTSVRSLLSRLARSLETFRACREEVPLHMMVVFLTIAQRKGIGAAELARLTGLSQSSVSRNVHALGRGKGEQPGLGLVTQIIDPRNPRAHVIRLTAKGVALSRDLANAMVGKAGQGDVAPPASQTQHLHWQNWID